MQSDYLGMHGFCETIFYISFFAKLLISFRSYSYNFISYYYRQEDQGMQLTQYMFLLPGVLQKRRTQVMLSNLEIYRDVRDALFTLEKRIPSQLRRNVQQVFTERGYMTLSNCVNWDPIESVFGKCCSFYTNTLKTPSFIDTKAQRPDQSARCL